MKDSSKGEFQMKHALSIVAAAFFLGSIMVAGTGCFTKGKAGYVCKSSKDCKGNLRCLTFYGRGQKRRQCRPPGTRSVSSKSGYTDFAIYLSWFLVFAAPIGGVAWFIWLRKQKGKDEPRPQQTQPPAS